MKSQDRSRLKKENKVYEWADLGDSCENEANGNTLLK